MQTVSLGDNLRGMRKPIFCEKTIRKLFQNVGCRFFSPYANYITLLLQVNFQGLRCPLTESLNNVERIDLHVNISPIPDSGYLVLY